MKCFNMNKNCVVWGFQKKIIIVIDNYLSALNAEWLRYGELAYQYGMEDILAMIKE